jgi:hypothetical protein
MLLADEARVNDRRLGRVEIELRAQADVSVLCEGNVPRSHAVKVRGHSFISVVLSLDGPAQATPISVTPGCRGPGG